MKTAISIPDNLFKDAEDMACRLGLSRSELYQRALTRFLEQSSGDVIREALDRVYSRKSDRNLDALVRIAGEQILSDEDW